MRSSLVLAAVLVLPTVAACGKKEDPGAGAAASAAAATAAPATAARASGDPGTATPAAAPSEPPPKDGKYERVTVEGTTVPMINVMNNGAIVLVDTDGTKPRSWEEQYKRKRADLAPGQFDIHKTNTNKNDTFEDDAIDKEGLWIIDSKGNITKH